LKKIIRSLFILGLISVSVYGISKSGAWFSDTEVLGDNTFDTGTIKISVSAAEDQPWSEFYTVDDMKPSTTHYMQMVITNDGRNEADIWKRLTGFSYIDNLSPEPEGEESENCFGGMIHYDMEINGQVLIHENDGYVLDTCQNMVGVPVSEQWIYLGRLNPDEEMAVDQSYHLDSTTDNWAQGDRMSFDVEIYAQQIVGGAPSPDSELTGFTRCEVDGGLLEEYNIGTADDFGHALAGWSNSWSWGGNYGGGDDGSFRLLTGQGDGCIEGFEEAYFTMHAGDQYAVQLKLHHLDGSQDDSFDLYVKTASVWTKFAHYQGMGGPEEWITTIFNLPVPLTGNVEFKLVATSPNEAWCNTWGQVAFSWANLYHSTCPEEL